jgi:hypothetical protein
MLGSSLPLATLGTMILWLGWFGFNGGSQLAMGSAADAVAIANIYVNTNLAAAGGVLASMVLTQIVYKKIDLSMVLNGAIAGLVSITAEPLTPSPGLAILIGAVGGVLAVFAVPLLYKLRIDDVVGAIPAPPGRRHLGHNRGPDLQSRYQLHDPARRHRRGRRVHFPRQPARLVGAQGHDRHPPHRGRRTDRHRPSGARHGGVSRVRPEPRPLNARAVLRRWPAHPPMPGKDPFPPRRSWVG